MRQCSCLRQLLYWQRCLWSQLVGAVWTAVSANIWMWYALNSLLKTTELIGCIKTSLLLRLLSTWMWRRAVWQPGTKFSTKPASPSLGLLLLPYSWSFTSTLITYPWRCNYSPSTNLRTRQTATVLFSSPGCWITRNVNHTGVTKFTPPKLCCVCKKWLITGDAGQLTAFLTCSRMC
jgi:hypothetical protein